MIVSRIILLTALLALVPVGHSMHSAASASNAEEEVGVFARPNLVAWCIVPFDARKRGPAERAEMLVRLGIKNVAYDWRAEHIPTFEEEILQYKKHHLNYFAFWSWHDSMQPLIAKYDIHPQIWVMMRNSTAESQEARIADAVEGLNPLVEKTRALGCKLAIYNHGGWEGEPANMIDVVKELRKKQNANHVGIVYNFHHGHEHISDFAVQLQAMLPYLFCLNVNGMEDLETVASGKNKILPIGQGRHEQQMLKIVKDSGYSGPIGILDHRDDTDSEESLRDNLQGLDMLIEAGL